jgi:hypothetical protein
MSSPIAASANATIALDAHARTNGNHDEPPEDRVTDLLTDLRHYADRHGIDWTTVTDRAELHYAEEAEA